MSSGGARLVSSLLGALVCGLTVFAAPAAASSSGIASGQFRDSALGCNNCHSGGKAPTVSLTGPTTVTPGSTVAYTFEIGNPSSQPLGGLNVSAPNGALSTGGSSAANTRVAIGVGGRPEITHMSPKASVSGMTTFTFEWTAPSGSYAFSLLTAWGNAVNGNGTNQGDRAGTTCLGLFPAPFSEDHFKLYKAKTRAGAPKFVRPADVRLADQFEDKLTTVVKPSVLGSPVDKDGSGVINPAIHLECYTIKDAKTDPPQPKFQGHRVEVTNQFCSQTIDVIKPAALCVPSLADQTTAPSTTLPPNNVDHFKCYRAKPAKGFPKFVPRRVVLTDDFDSSKVTTVLAPDSFCNPVDKNGEGIKDVSLHLACYKIKDAKSDPPQPKFVGTDVFTGNQFGPEQLTATQATLLCVPSLKVDLGAIP